MRVAVVLALAGSLAAAALLPPEHLHESDETHPSARVHRHFALDDHDLNEHGRHDARLDHGDAHVVWLSAAWLHQSAAQIDQPVLTVAGAFSAPPATTQHVKLRFDDAAPPHGPPRECLRYRGPPLSPA